MLFVEVISTIFGGDYCSKLRSISGTHDQLQVHGAISGQAYLSQKVRLIALNKRILKPNKLHQAVERELKNSLINLPTQETTRHQGNLHVVFCIVMSLCVYSQ